MKQLDLIAESLKSERPYFRALLLPYQPGSKLYERITSFAFDGEIIAVIQPHLFKKFLKHQWDFFRVGETATSIDESKLVPRCIVIWINEKYRVLHPPPSDVEECFTLWGHKEFGVYDFIYFDAV